LRRLLKWLGLSPGFEARASFQTILVSWYFYGFAGGIKLPISRWRSDQFIGGERSFPNRHGKMFFIQRFFGICLMESGGLLPGKLIFAGGMSVSKPTTEGRMADDGSGTALPLRTDESKRPDVSRGRTAMFGLKVSGIAPRWF